MHKEPKGLKGHQHKSKPLFEKAEAKKKSAEGKEGGVAAVLKKMRKK